MVRLPTLPLPYHLQQIKKKTKISSTISFSVCNSCHHVGKLVLRKTSTTYVWGDAPDCTNVFRIHHPNTTRLASRQFIIFQEEEGLNECRKINVPNAWLSLLYTPEHRSPSERVIKPNNEYWMGQCCGIGTTRHKNDLTILSKTVC